MKRMYFGIMIVALSLGLACRADAQMGMNLFQKPVLAKFMNPVVGKGAQYETARTDTKGEKTRTMELGVVGKESVEGKEGFWMQVSMTDEKGNPIVTKALYSRDDFQVHKMIVQMKGQPPMEMPFNPSASHEMKMEETMKEWHLVGTESITVPAGTFTCEHWRNDTKGSDFWASEKITPFGMVKHASKSETMILTKLLSEVPDRITGPVTKFDPQMMMQQMQRDRQAKP